MAHLSAEADSSCCFRTTWSNWGRTNTEMTTSDADTTDPQHPPHSLSTKKQESPWAVWIFLGTFFPGILPPWQEQGPSPQGPGWALQAVPLCWTLTTIPHLPVWTGKMANAASKKKGWIKKPPQKIHFTLCCLLLENCLVFCHYILYLFFLSIHFFSARAHSQNRN